MRRGISVLLASLILALPSPAQEPGWSYSPLPREGDRAALGCASGSTKAEFHCLAVRCEVDGQLAIYAYATEPAAFTGRWTLQIDKQNYAVFGLPGWMSQPYTSRIAEAPPGLTETLVADLIAGAIAMMEFGTTGEAVPVPLGGTARWVGGTQIACEPKKR